MSNPNNPFEQMSQAPDASKGPAAAQSESNLTSEALNDPSVAAAKESNADGASFQAFDSGIPSNPRPNNDLPNNPFMGSAGGIAPQDTHIEMGFPGEKGNAFDSAPSSFGGSSADGSEAELAARWDKLKKAEENLKNRERALNAGESSGEKDWPSCCPFTRNNIEEDITSEVERAVMKRAYIILIINFVLLGWNLICQSAFAAGPENSDGFQAVGLAIVYCLLGYPGALYLWYKVLYTACRVNKASYYFITMAVLAISDLFWIAHAVGFPGTGMAGVISLITQLDYNGKHDDYAYIVCAMFQIIHLAGAIPCILMSVKLLKDVRTLYNASGGDDAAKAEAAKMAASNETIRNAAVSGAMAGAKAKK